MSAQLCTVCCCSTDRIMIEVVEVVVVEVGVGVGGS